MILPGLYAILSPITIGFLIGPRCLTGLLGGSIASGMMLAIMMANAGGAWDNSKKVSENIFGPIFTLFPWKASC
jgi:K(+)-stimulated pyrophosphate-energized sodium pump